MVGRDRKVGGGIAVMLWGRINYSYQPQPHHLIASWSLVLTRLDLYGYLHYSVFKLRFYLFLFYFNILMYLSDWDLLDMPTGSNNCLIFVYKLSCVNIYQMMWNIVRLSDQSAKYEADRFNCWQDGRAEPGVTLLLGVSHHGTLWSLEHRSIL